MQKNRHFRPRRISPAIPFQFRRWLGGPTDACLHLPPIVPSAYGLSMRLIELGWLWMWEQVLESTDLDVSRDRAWLAVADARGDVHVWSLATLAGQPPLRGEFQSPIKIIAWSPQASTLAIADGDGRVTTRNWPDDGKPKIVFNDGDDIAAMRWLPGGTQVVTSGQQ